MFQELKIPHDTYSRREFRYSKEQSLLSDLVKAFEKKVGVVKNR